MSSLNKHWNSMRFDQFILLQRGKDLPKTAFQEGDIPVASSAGVIGFHNIATVKGPGVTVAEVDHVVLDDKLAITERKHSHYTDFFKTLLHELMTAQIRVHELDLDALGVPALD